MSCGRTDLYQDPDADKKRITQIHALFVQNIISSIRGLKFDAVKTYEYPARLFNFTFVFLNSFYM
jgi:hypothetical protein